MIYRYVQARIQGAGGGGGGEGVGISPLPDPNKFILPTKEN